MIYDDDQGDGSYGDQRRSAERGCGEMIILFIAVVIAVSIIATVAARSLPR